MTRFRQPGLFILLLAACLWAAYLPKYPVGYFNDDAKYIGLSKSLLQGRFADPALAIPAAENLYLPGYPLFLAPAVACVQPHWSLLKLTSLVLTLLSCVFLFKLSAPWLSGRHQWVLVALFAFNPVTAQLSGVVLSEPLFVCLEVAVFWMFGKVLKRPDQKTVWGLRAVLTGLVLTRPIGFLVLPAMMVPLALGKKWKSIYSWLGLPVLGWSLWHLRNYFLTQRVNTYSDFWKAQWPYLTQHPAAVLDNTLRVAYTTGVQTLQGVVLPHTAIGIVLCVLSAGAVLLLWMRGLRRLARDPAVPVAWVYAVGLFTSLCFLVQAAWASIDMRYAWPLLPFLLIGVIEGLRSHRIAKGVFALLVVAYTYRHGVLLNRVWDPSSAQQRQLPWTTFAWMQTHLPPGAQVVFPATEMLWLYTGFRGVPGEGAANREAFRSNLVGHGISYALYRPLNALTVHGTSGLSDQPVAFQNNAAWMTSWPEGFRLIYLNREEKTALFQVQGI